MTTLKGRKPLGEIATSSGSSNNSIDLSGDITVEQYLTKQCDEIILDLQKHCKQLVAKLNKEYLDGSDAIQHLMAEKVPSYKPPNKKNSDSDKEHAKKRVCVTLKCRTGAHSGQKFRLEQQFDRDSDDSTSTENVFKIGRSTGKLFKEKGVSLYKDKEVSTTHAKIEIRNQQVFLIDTQSTNGTLLNGAEVAPQMPLRLQAGDVISLGGTELEVHVSDLDEAENFASV